MMPNTSETIERKTEDTRNIIVNGLIALALVVILLIAFGNTGIKADSFVPLDELEMSTDVISVDGTATRYEDGGFDSLGRGDYAELRITLPETARGTEVYLPLFNAIVNMRIDGKLIYGDSYDPSNLAAHYGNRIYEVPLPDGRAGHVLTIEILANQIMGFSELDEAGLVQANEGWKLILEDKVSVFVVFLTLMTLALFGTLYCAVVSIVQRRISIGLPIALFELSLIAWFFGTHHMFHLLFGNVEVCAKIEYYALYFIPLPLGLFIYQVVNSPGFKRATLVAVVAYFIYYLVVTVLELSPIQVSYSLMTPTLHPIAGVMFLLLSSALFFGVKGKREGHVFLLRYGAIFAVACGVLELLRYNLVKFTPYDKLFTLNGLSILAILTIMSFTVAVALYLFMTVREEFALRVERAQLMELAYKDILTDMPNRAGLRRRVDQMKEDGVRDYTMAFIDLNDLKVANDKYGHDIGDKLLVLVAQAVRETFAEHGFCARYGGDEFVACVFGDEELGMRLLDAFQRRIDDINERGEFPFEASVACGVASSNADDYIDPIEAIHIADSFMYENKKDAKAAATGLSESK